VFVDAGNKSLGLQALMAFTGALPHEVRQATGSADVMLMIQGIPPFRN
jgi:hypothetical protein